MLSVVKHPHKLALALALAFLGPPPGVWAQVVSDRSFAPLELRPIKLEDLQIVVSTKRFVYFDFDSFDISADARSLIEAHGQLLRADAKLRVALEGHTGERGGREYSLGLGQKRADAVRKALLEMGVADSQIEAVSFGKDKPAVLGTSEAAMRENRRVEINYR